MNFSFPTFYQTDKKNCGIACLKIVSKYYKHSIDFSYLEKITSFSAEGVSLSELERVSNFIGFTAVPSKIDIELLSSNSLRLPIILLLKHNHYVVLYRVKYGRFHISDPSIGKYSLSREEFLDKWGQDGVTGYALALEPPSVFFNDEVSEFNSVRSILHFLKYLFKYRRQIAAVLLLIIIVNITMAALPLLTRAVIDVGINNEDSSLIKILLVSHIALVLFTSFGNWVRKSIVSYLSTRLRSSLLLEFLNKIFRLPYSIAEQLILGDVMQKVKDNDRVQNFLIESMLNIIYAIASLVVFSSLLLLFDSALLWIMTGGSLLYIGCSFMFWNVRKKLDLSNFKSQSEAQNYWIDIFNNLKDIKSYQLEIVKQKEWIVLNNKGSKNYLKLSNVNNLQELVLSIVSSLKNVGMMYYAIFLVIDGTISLGTLIALQFIIANLTHPLASIVSFFSTFQLAKLSMNRVNEFKKMPSENYETANFDAPQRKKITFSNVHFKFHPNSPYILKGINFELLKGRAYAIVGESGSGKTTILNLLTGYYKPSNGQISVGDIDLQLIEPAKWKDQFSAVFDESSIFNQSILYNITFDPVGYDEERLIKACKTCEIYNDIMALKDNLRTPIGKKGLKLSLGQEKRILLARALYKQFDYLILDETTSSIESSLEDRIFKNILEGYKNKTIIFSSHRLSTLRHSYLILYIKHGRIAEQGTLEELINKKGELYNSFKEQMLTTNLNVLS